MTEAPPKAFQAIRRSRRSLPLSGYDSPSGFVVVYSPLRLSLVSLLLNKDNNAPEGVHFQCRFDGEEEIRKKEREVSASIAPLYLVKNLGDRWRWHGSSCTPGSAGRAATFWLPRPERVFFVYTSTPSIFDRYLSPAPSGPFLSSHCSYDVRSMSLYVRQSYRGRGPHVSSSRRARTPHPTNEPESNSLSSERESILAAHAHAA